MKYYFDNMDLNKYPTLWDGFLEYNVYSELLNERLVSDIITEICDINFYINIHDDKIYMSICRDSDYYYYQFEQHIKHVITALENAFFINIENGQFNATEVKHQGNQYRYTISKNLDLSIVLKKKILNWEKYESKKVNITNKLSHLSI